MIVTGEQLRAARAMARIEQVDLARKAVVSVDTIKRLERTVGPISANVTTMAAVVSALEAAGVEFTNGGQPGVRMKAAKSGAQDAFDVLFERNDIDAIDDRIDEVGRANTPASKPRARPKRSKR